MTINNSDSSSKPHTTVQIPHYQIVETVYSGSRTLVYRAIRTHDQLPVVIKLLKNEYPTFSELVQFRNQYTIAKNLCQPGIIQTYSLEPYRNSYALVMEDFGGISLQEWAGSGKNSLSLREFLAVAIALCNTLDILYRQHIIHKDIKPANILINPETKEIKLIDFSIASLLPRETQEIQNANSLEGTLAYLSPEQTGRMNRGIDYRSDFYSLGVTFYELLTGELPFKSNDPMELVHCHLAQTPISAHQINPQIPLVLSEIITKLMAKNAEDRYQSALGIKYDLELCLQQLQKTSQIEYFEIGERDLSDRFIIPEKLYGREQEVQALLNAFDRISDGNTEMMLVAGFSGIGKTAVVNEVHKPITRQRGYFIKGKYDQFQRNIPFSAFVQAFRDLMGQLLSESDIQLQIWKTKILEAVGDNGQVLIEVIPELELIIGEQPTATELSGTAAQNRFNLLIQNFIKVFTSQEHPLVIFIDDLQWADSASLNLLKLLMQDTRYLLILGAYRDNEVSPAHPFISTVDEMSKAGAVVNTITLQPLSLLNTNYLVADTLNCDLSIAQPLTELVYQKTIGNPFFTTQFLKSLYEDQQIIFDQNERYWQCDIAQVKALAITDDVVEFMALQLQRLPRETQDALKLAACIGAQFDLDTLAIISQRSAEVAATELWKALQEGLIIPNTENYKFFIQSDNVSSADAAANSTYRFLHDRVQQAAYLLIPEENKQITHLKIGQLIKENCSEQEREEKIFDIVGHFNMGKSLITQTRERTELAQLNLAAGKKARLSTAYDAAIAYFTIGMELLPEDCWNSNYELTLALHEATGEVAYLSGQFEQFEAIAAITLKSAKTLLDKITTYETQIQVYLAQNCLAEAMQTSLNVLSQLGIQLPRSPNRLQVLLGLAKTKLILAGKTRHDLLNLPIMSSPEKLAAMRILAMAISGAFLRGSKLLPLLMFQQVNLSVRSGNTPLSAAAYSCYGIILCGSLGDINQGYRFGQLSLQILDQFNAKDLRPKVLAAVNCTIFHWKQHLRSTLLGFQEGYQIGLETGDLESASACAANMGSHLYWCGSELLSLAQTLHYYVEMIRQAKQHNPLFYASMYHQITLNLIGESSNPSLLEGSAYSATQNTSQKAKAAGDRTGLFVYYVNQTYLSYLFGEVAKACQQATLAKQYVDGGTALYVTVPFYLYDSLSQLGLYPHSTKSEQQQILDHIAKNQQKLHKWAGFAPMNTLHKWCLVEAEKCRVLGRNAEAMEMYDRAISGAKENEFVNEEALANELAAKFYLEWGKEKIAQVYMTEAYYCYARWGAKAKVVDLEIRYPQLLQSILQQSQTSFNALETLTSITHSATKVFSTSISDSLDFASVIKAAQALSSTIELDELLKQLTQIILQNSGGNRCILVLPDQETWHVRAISTPETTELCSEPLEDHPDVPIKLIQYVKRTQSVVVIDNLQTDLPVIDDYLIQHNPKSVLCLPILNQGHLVGILYLKNEITAGVFTSDRLSVINFLCTQAAISLENARLYQQSQNYAHQLEQSQIQIIQSEKMSALGNLVAGVAHEINNPVGFLTGNLNEAKSTVQDLVEHLHLYSDRAPEIEIADHAEDIDLDYIIEDLPKMIDSMQLGCDRIKDISTSLCTFSRADKDYKVPFNIHSGIDSTILILKYRLKANDQRPAIEVVKDYGNLPAINCFPGQLNQVFMNILANAIDALDESNHGRTFAEIKVNPNCITITTSVEHNLVKITIADNGMGMTESVKSKIFDHLFTTKAVGKGTGLGLAIARQIVEEKHGGSLNVNSILGKGTEFIITLPIKAA
ncbi:trifunctional serine/threonine-protein kinase/ATP-binding protein/sensor histidine kinase [Microcoleus sp. B4-D4]|uniref:trifunctional serine/threonine-protein kinase/ATP-binding protein/sensor histidine kinase n=1 Tax=Microcoleus sp. B4-D4 TaxID=2818667 RepID=UPI002FD60831